MKTNKQQLLEDLKRFNSIVGYDVTGKKMINEAPEDEEEGGDEFDFGDEGGDAEAGGLLAEPGGGAVAEVGDLPPRFVGLHRVDADFREIGPVDRIETVLARTDQEG